MMLQVALAQRVTELPLREGEMLIIGCALSVVLGRLLSDSFSFAPSFCADTAAAATTAIAAVKTEERMKIRRVLTGFFGIVRRAPSVGKVHQR